MRQEGRPPDLHAGPLRHPRKRLRLTRLRKLFWEKTLRRPWPAEVEMARANFQFKLPVVLSATETRLVLDAVTAPDHHACLSLIYSCGLRLGEGLSLQVRDIDSERKLLHIREGKGNRDRYVPMSQRTLEVLREQWKTHRNPVWIFPAKGHGVKGFASRGCAPNRMLLQVMLQLLSQETSTTSTLQVSFPAKRIVLLHIRFVVDQPPETPK